MKCCATIVFFLGVSYWLLAVQGALDTTHGNEFFFAFFPDGFLAAGPFLLNDVYISATQNTNCTMNYFYTARDIREIFVPAESVVRQRLPDDSQLFTGTRIENKGIRINCTGDVWVYAYNRYSWSLDSADSYSILPLQSLSKEYLVPSINNNPLIGVAAASDNTLVTVHLQSTCGVEYKNDSYQSGDVINFELNKQDVLEIIHYPPKSYATYDCDFAGTRIETSSPSAVYSGSFRYHPRDHVHSTLMLQVPPLTAFTKYIIVPHVPGLATQSYLRVLAAKDNTSIKITAADGGGTMSESFIINGTQILDYSYTASADLVISSSERVLVIQNTDFDPLPGGLSMVIPGTDLYETQYVVQSIVHDDDSNKTDPVLTIIAEKSVTNEVLVNGEVPQKIQWNNVTLSDFAVGIMTAQEGKPYLIKSTFPVLVRMHQFVHRESYGFIGGYKTSFSVVQNAVHLQCLQDKWLLTVQMTSPRDADKIYLGVESCTGIRQGNKLIFNVTYDQCQTEETLSNGKITYKNSIISADRDKATNGGDINWQDDITCSQSANGTDSVHIYPKHNTTHHVTVSGEIQGSPVHISIFKDASFQTPFEESQHEASKGQPLFVDVAASGATDLVMVVSSCVAQLQNNLGNPGSRPLISDGCPADQQVQVLESKRQEIKFKFEMFDLPNDDDGIFVKCDVTFCRDLSPHCHSGCDKLVNPGVIGK